MLRLLRETVIVPFLENIFLNRSSCTVCVVWQRTTIVLDFPFGWYTFKSPYRNPSIYALSASVPSKSYLGYLVWALLLVLKGIFNSFVCPPLNSIVSQLCKQVNLLTHPYPYFKAVMVAQSPYRKMPRLRTLIAGGVGRRHGNSVRDRVDQLRE